MKIKHIILIFLLLAMLLSVQISAFAQSPEPIAPESTQKEYSYGAWDMVKTVLIAMVPVIELRGAIPIALEGYNFPLWLAFLLSFLGNIIIIPPAILCTRIVIEWLKKIRILEKLITKFENKLIAKGTKALKYETLGLMLFVAIPLPGTGAWTGSMIAGVFKLRMKLAFPVIVLGVLIAGVIVTCVTYGTTWLIGQA